MKNVSKRESFGYSKPNPKLIAKNRAKNKSARKARRKNKK